MNNVNRALSNLDANRGDEAVFQYGEEEVKFNLELKFTTEQLEDLLTKERIESITTMILKVKKPDYLGTSMWDFKHAGRLIPAKIIDADWLQKFQNRKIDIRPGDSIRAKVNCIVKYGHDNSVVGNAYEIVQIEKVLPASSDEDQYQIETE